MYEQSEEMMQQSLQWPTKLILRRAVSTEQGASLAKDQDAHFIEVSAKTGNNVELLFKQIAATLPGTETSQMVNSVVNNPTQTNNVKLDNLQNQNQEKTDKKSCC